MIFSTAATSWTTIRRSEQAVSIPTNLAPRIREQRLGVAVLVCRRRAASSRKRHHHWSTLRRSPSRPPPSSVQSVVSTATVGRYRLASGHGARRVRDAADRMSVKAPWPCEPITIRSAPIRSASAMMPRRVGPHSDHMMLSPQPGAPRHRQWQGPNDHPHGARPWLPGGGYPT